MENNKDICEDLIDRYLRGEVTEQEAQVVNDYFNKAAERQPDLGKIKDIVARKNRVWHRISPYPVRNIRPFRWPYLSLAAAVAILVIVGTWLFFIVPGEQGDVNSIASQVDIAPGGFGATLTMADGRQVALDTAKKGAVIGTTITYEDGTAVLEKSQSQAQVVDQLIATTGRGQVYTFTLSDGTKVWLNADSKLSFPSRFEGRERRVTLDGEGFFVVKHEVGNPFYVVSKGQLVEDLGTSFNIRSYINDGPQVTTLVEGAAKVNDVALRPRQQAVRTEGSPISLAEADLDQVLGWQQGNFVFRGETLEEVFRTVARWYDVDVVFAREQTKHITVGGTISRSRTIRAVLDLMERTGKVKCDIQGKQITVR
ncbi:FecR family protein [Sphingobacterium faecale]|uniref:DUF4974 domain-containing protein n=1 Tax=Sphingobacterium faecale TaxID=2803775 RepID=A0ABS1R2S4_9SPHI|nr:FecR domain-containing protein [Sphingobacterium faecale]MBL1409011.1 DUF4974 domain-containing protein [Sphingobacterium faecale]